MSATPHLQADLIKSFSTKFSSHGVEKQFQIAMLYDGNTIYKNFSSYPDYKAEHDLLLNAMREAKPITDNFHRI